MKRLFIVITTLVFLFLLAAGAAADWTYTVQRAIPYIIFPAVLASA